MNRIPYPDENRSDPPILRLHLELREPVVLAYLQQFQDAEQILKALEALKLGVIAVQTLNRALDSHLVKEQFGELEIRLKEHAGDFQTEIQKSLSQYFKEGDGVLPRSFDGLFGDKGTITHIFHRFFDPQDGRLARLMDSQVGPASKFAAALDPKNKQSVICLIEEKVSTLVADKLEAVLRQFSLDDDGSALSRMKKLLTESFAGLYRDLGIKEAKSQESERGHAKGFDFEADLYDHIAEWGRQSGDETQMVRGTPGVLKQKLGDHLITLGESTGAPGANIVVEAKDQAYKFKDAVAELQKAKKNREAVSGIFVFAKGCAPPEVGDFRQVGDDFYCTVDKQCLTDMGQLPFLWASVQIARAQAVTKVRKDGTGALNLERIQQQIVALGSWVPRLGDIITKAGTMQKSGEAIAKAATEIKDDLESRVREILVMLRVDSAAA